MGTSDALYNIIELMCQSLKLSMVHFDRDAEMLTELPVQKG